MDINDLELGVEQPLAAARDEVLSCLESGLAFLRGETPQAAQKLARRVLANIIVEHLDISGFSIHRKPSPEEPSLTTGAGNHADLESVIRG